jgi:transposase
MLWGCMSQLGIGHACRIEGCMDSQLYCQIIEGELLQSIEYFGKEVADIIVQQDNDPKHKSKLAIACFERNQIELLNWPPQSPHLNPIKHLWDYLKRQIAGWNNYSVSVHELWQEVQREWEKIPEELCKHLIATMPSRIQAVLKAKGGYTQY